MESDRHEPQPGEMREDGFSRIERRLTDLQHDVSALREEMASLRAAIADLHRRLRLIAGW